MQIAAHSTDFTAQSTLWGVICYTNADRAWCEWLYLTVNGYPVPPTLLGHLTRDGFALPQNLAIFPDPDAKDLADGYDEALRSARYLIVICSPNSANCKEIDAQIRKFKSAGGEERIIVVIAEGDPLPCPMPAEFVEGSDWLPPWLKWRLGADDKFMAAESTEPQIVDARKGREPLDHVMGTLIAALLDIPRQEFKVFGAPETPMPPKPHPDARFDDGVTDQIWAELSQSRSDDLLQQAPSESLPVGSRKIIALVGGLLAIILIVIGMKAANWFNDSPKFSSNAVLKSAENRGAMVEKIPSVSLVNQSNASAPTSGSNDQPSPPIIGGLGKLPQPEVKRDASTNGPPLLNDVAPPVGVIGGEKISSPVVSLKSSAPALATRNPTAITSIEAIPVPEPELPAELSPEQVADQAAVALGKQISRIRAEADQMVRNGSISEALPLYRQALDASQRYAALRSNDNRAQIEAAKLCLIVGSLQANYSSAAEAVVTLQTGKKILTKLKSGKETGVERSRTLESIQAQLRHIEADAPRFRADR